MIKVTKYIKILLIIVLTVILIHDVMYYQKLCERTNVYTRGLENFEKNMIGGNIERLYRNLYTFEDVLDAQNEKNE